ncbi:MAG: hypothetical protein U1F67_07990 [Rubrivivax sp.]
MRAWQDAIAAAPAPAKGCFTARYPETTWRKTACLTASKQTNRPITFDIGGANHVVAHSATGTIRSATGSFENVTPANLTATGPLATGGTAPTSPLQINFRSQFLPVSSDANIAAQAHRRSPTARRGSSSSTRSTRATPNPRIFIEYWMQYGPSCPPGWQLLEQPLRPEQPRHLRRPYAR